MFYWKTKKQKNIFDIIIVILLSFIVIGMISKGNWNFGLYDDNQTQWLPIIDKAYQTFFRTRELPTIDFFQMKGMKIYDQGYYGLWNPFMLIAYVLRTYVFFFFDTNTITVYIVIMILLGNICCYKILKEYGVNRYQSILFSSILLSSAIYVALIYWYYIYNVYFILTWLLFRIIRKNETKSYYEYGAILALSLLMGNVQYTVYMYLAFMLLMLILGIQREKKVLRKLFSNTVVMGFFSIFHLSLLLMVSLRSVDFSGSSNEFYSNALHPFFILFFSWIPSGLLGIFGEMIENIVYGKIALPDTSGFPGAKSYYMGAFVFAGVIFLLRKKTYAKNWFYKVTSACFIVVCIFLIIAMGKTGILAIFIEQVPFLNSFRILAKYLVLIPPLLIPCVAIVLGKQEKKNNMFFLIILLFVTLGFIQNRQIIFGVSEVQTEHSIENLKTEGVDYYNYRIVSFASYNEIQVIYPQWEEFAKREKISLEEKFSKNAATTAEIITLGGYDLSFDYKQFQMSENIMGTVSGYASEFGYDNMVIEEYFFNIYDRNRTDYQKNIKNLKEQIQNNSAKYFIFTKESAYIEIFQQMLTDMGLELEWKKPFLDNTEIIAVKNIMPVVVDNCNTKVEADIAMNKILFAGQSGKSWRIGMYYDDNLRAFHVDEEGRKSELSILPDEKGYIFVSGTSNSGDGTIEIIYHNSLYEMGKIWTIIVCFLIFIMIFGPEMIWIKRLVYFLEEKIEKGLQYLSFIQPKKGIWVCFILLFCCYSGFLIFYYLHVQCTVPDEEWFLQMFGSVHNLAAENIFAYLGETENYLGYGQVYWILGSIFSNMYILRIASFIMLLGSMILTLREVKIRFGMQMIPYAGILWISMPFMWFSDKIVGPEIFGLFLAILGLSMINTKKSNWVGWCLLGISCAVKMNYAIFIFAGFFTELQKTEKRKLVLVKAGLMGSIGFILGNPILIWDFKTFMENLIMEDQIVLNQLAYIFTLRNHEWDSVMINGVFWGYISAFLLLVFIIGLLLKNSKISMDVNKNLIYRKSGQYGIYMMILSLLQVVICCRNTFLGWYLLPFCYFLVMAMCSLFDYRGLNKKYRNLCQWSLIGCLFINGILLLPEHIDNRKNDIEYMNIISNREEIIQLVKRAKQEIEVQEQEIKWHYLLDFHMEEYSYNMGDYGEFCVNNAEGITVIGERMRIVNSLDDIVKSAIAEEDGLSVLRQFDDFWIVKRGCE